MVHVVIKSITTIQYAIAVYLIFAFSLYFINQIMPIAPLSAHDFVVDKYSEILIASDHDERIFVYSKDMKLIKTFKISDEIIAPLLAIDESNNIYMLKGNTIYKYDMNGFGEKLSKIDLSLPSNWRLAVNSTVEHFTELREGEIIPETDRLRRISKPGDILFFNTDSLHRPIQDPFTDSKGNKYESECWFNGITVVNASGDIIGHLKPPLFLRVFIVPFPGIFLIVSGISIFVISGYIKKLIAGGYTFIV